MRRQRLDDLKYGLDWKGWRRVNSMDLHNCDKKSFVASVVDEGGIPREYDAVAEDCLSY